MSRPYLIPVEEITIGESWKPTYQLLDVSGNAIDISPAAISVVLRLRKRGSTTLITRTKGVSGETSYVTDGTDGSIKFLIDAATTAAWTAGFYNVEVMYGDTGATPDTVTVFARGSLIVVAAMTGTI